MVIGAVLFAAIALVSDQTRPTVRLEARDLEQLAAYWEMQTQRPPTRDELASIIQERVDEELMARLTALDEGRRLIDGRIWCLEGGPYTLESLWDGELVPGG